MTQSTKEHSSRTYAAKDDHIDTLEVLLNPSILQNKFSGVSQENVYAQGRRLLQDLLSVARFGTPAIVPAGQIMSGRVDANSDENGGQMQTLKLSERQGQACKVYQLASLSLNDIFEQIAKFRDGNNHYPKGTLGPSYTTSALDRSFTSGGYRINRAGSWGYQIACWCTGRKTELPTKVRKILGRDDMKNGTLLAITNALYCPVDPSQMMLHIPSKVLAHLRSISFHIDDLSDAFLARNIFEDILQLISSLCTPSNEGLFREFTAKLCSTVNNVLFYEAAWKSGRQPVNETCLIRDAEHRPFEEDEPRSLSVLLGNMDRDEIEQLIRSKNMPPLGSGMVMLALVGYSCELSQYEDSVSYLQVAGRFLSYEQEKSSAGYAMVDTQFRKLSFVTDIGALVSKMDERRDAKLEARLRTKVVPKTTVAPSPNDDEAAMDVEMQEDEAATEAERQMKSEEAVDRAMVEDLSIRLMGYLTNFGALETELQLRALGHCIDGKMWKFLANYCRQAVGVVDANAHPAILEMSTVLDVDLKETTSVSCLDQIFSADMNPIDHTRFAALDMIRGLLVNVPKLNTRKRPGQPPRAQIPSALPPSNQHPNHHRGRRSFQSETKDHSPSQLLAQQPAPQMDDDAGHAAILKLFSLVRFRGVPDVFGAILAGALSPLMPEKSRITLSEFGYYALFTTSMECVSSWVDSRVKIIAMISNGQAGKAVEVVPGAKLRLTRMLLALYEDQIQFESDALTTKIKIETKARQDAGLTTSSSTTSLFSTKSSSRMTRFSLCLTELYNSEGMHREALASFLNGCMVCSKSFSDIGRLERRVWSAYTHGLSGNVMPSPQPGGQSTLASQAGGSLAQIPPLGIDPLSSLPQFPTSGALAMTGINANSGQLSVGLGLLPGETVAIGNTAPPPPSALSQTGQPSTAALKAIESCMHLNEPLAGAALQQFLPKMDYAQAFQAIRFAHDKGLLTYTPISMSTSKFQPRPSPMVSGSTGGDGSLFSAHSWVLPSLKVESSVSVFAPESRLDVNDPSFTPSSINNSINNTVATNESTTQKQQQQLQQQQQQQQQQPVSCLDLIFDLPMLELVSFIFKEARDQDGLQRLQTKINSNRMALDNRQPFKEEVYAMAQQDLLTRLWAKYVRLGSSRAY
ncbi:hypothetical protein BG004_008184 [Podila humilis]|nr:hypothetical protein BG004_008184 [Podila humilis]